MWNGKWMWFVCQIDCVHRLNIKTDFRDQLFIYVFECCLRFDCRIYEIPAHSYGRMRVLLTDDSCRKSYRIGTFIISIGLGARSHEFTTASFRTWYRRWDACDFILFAAFTWSLFVTLCHDLFDGYKCFVWYYLHGNWWRLTFEWKLISSSSIRYLLAQYLHKLLEIQDCSSSVYFYRSLDFGVTYAELGKASEQHW